MLPASALPMLYFVCVCEERARYAYMFDAGAIVVMPFVWAVELWVRIVSE